MDTLPLVLSPQEIDKAVLLLKQGELVAFPTETVYGLGALLFDPLAIEKIFIAKGRARDNPLIGHISNLEQLRTLTEEISPEADRLIQHFWPGPLTLIFKRAHGVPAAVSAGLESIAVRMPSHPIAQQLIERLGSPLAAPSANLSGKPSATHSDHVRHDFKGKIAAVIEGGNSSLGIESTVLSLLSSPPTLLRLGVITREDLEQVLGCKIRKKEKGDLLISPGMKYRHYAPDTPLKLFTSRATFEAYLHERPSSNRLVVEKCLPETLYHLLRQADLERRDEIALFCDSATLQNPALMDRLTKAAEK